jgi:hypothetical protein
MLGWENKASRSGERTSLEEREIRFVTMKQQLEKPSLEKARMVVEDGGRKQRSDVAEAERGMRSSRLHY